MQVDVYTRAVLTVIAVCLVLLVARSFGLGPAETPQAAASSRPRYAISNVRIGRVPALLRLDTETGEVWRFVTRGGVARWDELVQTGEEAEPDEPAAEAGETAAPDPKAAPGAGRKAPGGAPAPAGAGRAPRRE